MLFHSRRWGVGLTDDTTKDKSSLFYICIGRRASYTLYSQLLLSVFWIIYDLMTILFGRRPVVLYCRCNMGGPIYVLLAKDNLE